MQGGRLRYLDGLRGVAIILVIIWHFMGPTDAQMLPYGDRYAALPIVSSGWMGVELFFLISGYVIFMTLERCAGFRDFAVRRFQRLYPAMLIATVLLFAADRLLGIVSPHGAAQLIDLLPGLTFVGPSFWHAFLHIDPKSLSGVFWTLYVECAFYLIFGGTFFKLGWKRAIVVIFALFIVTRGGPALLVAFHAPALLLRAFEPAQWLGFDLFGWFASGALFFKAVQRDDRKIFALAVVVGLIAAITQKSAFPLTLAQYFQLVGVVALFALSHKWTEMQRFLNLPVLVFSGAISYPLYLIHSNLGVGLMGRAKVLQGLIPGELVALAAVALVVGLAWLIERFAEPEVREKMQPVTWGIRHILRVHQPVNR
jgi:peptidoglycan/LPS O-acetylase OafA/YrhL